jgi:Cu+-exporting ATPase
LERLDGVHKADVQFKQEKATVTYEPDKVTVQQMIEAVKKSGFGAKSVP